MQRLTAELPDLDDALLMERVSKQDRAAFAQLVSRHTQRLIRTSYRLCLSMTEAEDIAQEVLLKLWQKPQQFNPAKAQLTTWLYRITLNCVLDRQRKQAGKLWVDLDDQWPSHQPSVVETLQERERRHDLKCAIAALPDRQREALALSYEHEMTNREAAASLSISVKAYESLLVRARQQLRQALTLGKEGC